MIASTALPVMIVANSLHGGGAERFASRLVCGLSTDRISVRLVLLRNEVVYELPESVPIEVLGYRSIRDLPKAVIRLRRLIKRHSPAVILGTGTAVNTVIGLALKAIKHRPAWVARVDTNPFRKDLRLRRMVLKRLYPLADAIVANSRGLKDALAGSHPRERERIRWIYNPVDFEQLDRLAQSPAPWSPSGEGPVLVTVGRAFEGKGWGFLLDVFENLRLSKPAELVFCGDGPLLEKLKTRAGRMRSGARIHFLGHCSNPFPIVSQADLFLLGSEAEGLPNALIEAQGMGICAVSNSCDYGPDEIVAHGKTGLLVDCHDRAQWSRAIDALLSDDALRASMGTHARKMNRSRFDALRRCRQWQELLLLVGARQETTGSRNSNHTNEPGVL